MFTWREVNLCLRFFTPKAVILSCAHFNQRNENLVTEAKFRHTCLLDYFLGSQGDGLVIVILLSSDRQFQLTSRCVFGDAEYSQWLTDPEQTKLIADSSWILGSTCDSSLPRPCVYLPWLAMTSLWLRSNLHASRPFGHPPQVNARRLRSIRCYSALLANESQDRYAGLGFSCALPVLPKKLSSLFGHPTQVWRKFNLRLRASPFVQG